MFASFVTYIISYETKYILNLKYCYTFRSNWMNRQTPTDCHIVCHYAVNYFG